ncbi:hypothetical protein Tco_1403215 [Tanacetum coccineum]
MDEIDQQNKATQEKLESPYGTESEIKVIKRFQPSQPDDDAQITFLGAESYDQIKLEDDASDSDSGLRSMPDDDLVSLTGFETLEAANNDSQTGIADNFNASVDMPAQLDPLGHLHEELRTLNTKVDQLESSISKKVTDEIHSSVPYIVADALKANLLGLFLEALKNTLPQMIKDSIHHSIQESVKEKLPFFMHKSNKPYKISSLTLYSSQFKNKVRKWVKVVSDKLASVQSTMATNSQHVHDLKTMYKDMVSLLEAAEVLKKANAEGDKWEKNNPKTPTKENPDQNQGEQQSEEKSSEKNVSDDEPPAKKLKFLIPTSSIPSPTPLKARMLEEFNKCIHERTNPLPITKISYRVNSSKEASMMITRGNDPLNLTVYDKFRLRTLGFSEWLEVPALASKSKGK